MFQQRIYALLTFVFLIAAVAVVLVEKAFKGDWNAAISSGGIPPTLKNTELQQDEAAAERSADSRIELVSAGQVHEQIAGIPQLAQLPWTDAEIELAFNASAGRACRLLPPNVFVTPLSPELEDGDKLRRIRSTALTIGLQVDPAHRAELPVASKSLIESYLADHVLAIQPTLVIDAAGGTFFDGTVQAAFYPARSPTITIAAEPMILDAVSSFRVLGMYDGSSLGMTPAKTLILAFRYFREQRIGTVQMSPTPHYDLMFLHLPEAGANTPMIAFATTDGRIRLEELDLSPVSIGSGATVMARIRFRDYKLMGQYPANPVVLGVNNRSLTNMPAEEFIQKLRGDETNPPVPLPQLLRTYHDDPPPIIGALPFPGG